MLLKMRIVTQDKEQYRNRIFKAQHYIDIFADYTPVYNFFKNKDTNPCSLLYN